MSSLNRFILLLFLYSVVLGSVTFAMTWVLPPTYFTPVLPGLFTFFFSVTIIVYAYLNKSKEEKFARFVNKFMITTFLKLFLFLVILSKKLIDLFGCFQC